MQTPNHNTGRPSNMANVSGFSLNKMDTESGVNIGGCNPSNLKRIASNPQYTAIKSDWDKTLT
tara:strand:- start:217 stop:405 length:189 start_codon:yes stop_codon:yes gene_type:complete